MTAPGLTNDAEPMLSTELTLSAVEGLTPEDAEAATEIDRLLAEGDPERVIDYVWSEAELRAAWGDR